MSEGSCSARELWYQRSNLGQLRTDSIILLLDPSTQKHPQIISLLFVYSSIELNLRSYPEHHHQLQALLEGSQPTPPFPKHTEPYQVSLQANTVRIRPSEGKILRAQLLAKVGKRTMLSILLVPYCAVLGEATTTSQYCVYFLGFSFDVVIFGYPPPPPISPNSNLDYTGSPLNYIRPNFHLLLPSKLYR